MLDTYCGKSCQTCGYRAQTGCRGCREQGSRECKLAHCCREKGHETCQSCTYNTQCGMYRGKDTAPQFRLAQKQAELEYQQSLREKGASMSKWLWVLFWLFVPTTIAGILSEWVPSLHDFGMAVAAACAVLYAVVLLKLSSDEPSYRVAGLLALAVSVINIPLLLTHNSIPLTAVNVILAIVDLVSSYFEFQAHANALEGVDNQLSEQWRTLWKWMIGATMAMVLGVIFTVIIIGALVAVAAAIAILVISILKLVYLYRTAQVFQAISAS